MPDCSNAPCHRTTPRDKAMCYRAIDWKNKSAVCSLHTLPDDCRPATRTLHQRLRDNLRLSNAGATRHPEKIAFHRNVAIHNFYPPCGKRRLKSAISLYGCP